jgi:spore germination protein GerM
MERRTKALVGGLVFLLMCGIGLFVYLLAQPNGSGCVFCGERMIVQVFLMNDSLDPEVTCTKVFPVTRDVPKAEGVGRVALNELLSGPTDAEQALGYSSAIPVGVSVKALTVENGVATADLSPELDRGVGGSCRVAAIRSQIAETLKQFPTVQSVVISIGGNSEEVLQP